MVTLGSLWLAILVSAVVVFFASWIAWMILPHHGADWKGLPNEDGFFESLQGLQVQPGQYMFPYCSSADWKDPETKKRWEAGPHGILNLWSGIPPFGGNLAKIFIFYLVVSLFVGYLGTLALGPGADFMKVFQVAGTAGVLAYVFGRIPNDIWFRTPGRCVLMSILDGLAYGLLTGVVFGLFWPAA
jgi:hypothetical protein